MSIFLYMKLIIWLWNPGKQYEETKHNIWFMFLDFLTSSQTSPRGEGVFSDFRLESKFKWEISEWIFKWEKTILLKPNTYMNLSWESLRKIVDFYKIDLEDIVIIYDDLSLEFGKIRFRDKGSAWGHNWIKSIIKHFSTDFKRIKVWVWFNDNYEVSDWVLSRFTDEEIDKLEDGVFDGVCNLLEKKI